MPRRPRHFVVDHPYHVVIRGNNRRRLFSFSRDRVRFLVLLRDAAGRFGLVVHAITLMTNHVHLVVVALRKDSISMAIKSACQRYAVWRNRQRGGSGKLFEERFFAEPIADDDHFGHTLAYAETNARRAGLTDHADEYEWSSLGLHTGRGRARWNRRFEGWIDAAGWYLDLGAEPADRQKAYRTFLAATLERAKPPPHWKKVAVIEGRSGARPRRPDGSSAA